MRSRGLVFIRDIGEVKLNYEVCMIARYGKLRELQHKRWSGPWWRSSEEKSYVSPVELIPLTYSHGTREVYAQGERSKTEALFPMSPTLAFWM